MSTRSVPLTNQLKQLADKVVNENQECAVPREETVSGFSLVWDVTDSTKKGCVTHIENLTQDRLYSVLTTTRTRMKSKNLCGSQAASACCLTCP